MHFVAVHAGHVEALGAAKRIQHRVVAGAMGAEPEIVADQHVLCAQAAHQHAVDEGLGNLRR
jgi:hypothetical protein